MSETNEPKLEPRGHTVGELRDFMKRQNPGPGYRKWCNFPGASITIFSLIGACVALLIILMCVSCDRDKLERDTAREIGKLKGQVYDAQIESENRLKANAALLLENTNLKKKVTILRDRQSQAGQIMYPTADLLKRLASMKFRDCIDPIAQNLKEIKETRKAMLNWLGIDPGSPVKYIDGKPVKVNRKKK